MIDKLISLIISEYAFIIYETIVIVILFLFIRTKRKVIKQLEQNALMHSKKEKQEALNNMLRNKRKEVQK